MQVWDQILKKYEKDDTKTLCQIFRFRGLKNIHVKIKL